MIAALIRTRARRFLALRCLGYRSMCYGRLGVLPDFSVPVSPGEKVLETFTEEFEVGSRMIKLETGLLARFANGAVVCNMGDTHVLSTVACGKGDANGTVRDFLPLTVEYQEKQYVKGAIPTTFTRREGPPRERELLCGRLIDRPIRPLFPAGFYHEVQIMINVLASDRKQDPDVMAANATSAALMLSDIPWEGPIGVIRLGRVDGRFIVNPSMDELTLSDLNLVYACTRDKTLMIDVQAREISEKDLEAGLRQAHPEAVKYIDPQLRLAEKAGKKKKEYTLSMITERTFEKIESLAESPIEAVFTDSSYGKFERGEALEKITQNVKAKLEEECDEESIRVLPKVVDAVRKKIVRRRIIEEGLRVDGRCLDEVRPLYCKAHIFPALHGSSLFSRGDTQVLCTVTVGTPADSQRLDSLVGPSSKHFMLHYNFPPFSINEVGKRGGLNRREVGHGTLAEKALLAVLPPEEDFPYTYRLNSEVMASDGSTSMATVCGGSMALMDAGIPVRQHVAGISVGLISYMDPLTGTIRDYRIVTDILGLEDHLGDMDFKIAGTRKGVTAIQLDIKPAGIPLDIICESLYHAKVGHLPILDRMEKEISRPRANALGLATRKYNNDSLWRFLNGYRKRKIEEETGARISLGDGTLTVVAKDQNAVEQALEKVDFIIGREIEVGGIYKGIVCSIKEYGAFVEFNGGQQGLLHISELSRNPVSKVSDAVSIGEELSLKCIGQDVRGNIKLSLKALQPQPQPIHYHATTNTPAKQAVEVSSSLDEVSNFTDSHLPKASQSEADYLDSAAYDTPEVVIRSAAECEALEAFHNQNDSQQCIETIKESSRSYTPLPLKNSEGSRELSGLFSREKSKLLVPNGEKKQYLQFTVDWGSSRKDTPGAPDTTPKDICSKNNNSGSSLHPKNLKLGDRLTASVFQIRSHGLVLDLGGGLRGMYKFEEGVRRDFNVGMKVQVKCSSFSSKGIPVMSLIEE